MGAACRMLLLLVAAFLLNSSFIHGRDITARKLAKPPKATIKTIRWDNGDIFDCVDIYKQPAFEHPKLKNHKLQMEPNSYPFGVRVKNVSEDKLGPWHKSGKCPGGSIPIRRQVITGLPIIRKNTTFGSPASYNNGHQYAVIHYFTQSQTIQGAQATIDIWDPSLAHPQGDFSLSQIWYIAESGSNLNTAEAGWQVYPARTGDSQPRLFVYWTDSSTGNFWLYVEGTAIGYWPNSIYNILQAGSNRVDWGGEILDSSGSNGFHTLTQMGSGYFPSAGYGLSSYIRDLFYTEDTQNWVAVVANALQGTAPAPNCYNYALENAQNGALWLFYGGPGCN
uniref:C-terminal peptidase n=1 Tax=Nepenthes alata TaxID=4376 RepID=A0A1L7NZU1_NEPAL|nr:C-terminal peptidase [Nepenthes alata]